MENFNNIPKAGTFGNAVDKINENFALAKEAIEKLGFKESACVGFYETSTALNTAMPEPSDGLWALVGSSTPFTVYVAADGEWVNSGLSYSVTVNISVHVVNNLTEGGTTSALSAEQGKVLNTRLGTIESPFESPHSNISDWVADVDETFDLLAGSMSNHDNRLSSLESEIEAVNLNGFYYTDLMGNVAFKYTPSDGLDAAKVSEHFKGLVGAGANSNVEAITEQGFYYTDSAGYVAVKYTPSDGLDAAKVSSHLKSLLDTYENLTETTYNI